MKKVLTTHRRAAGLTLAQVASRLKVHISTVSGWETQMRKPRPQFIPKIASVYGMASIEVERLFYPAEIAPTVSPPVTPTHTT